MESDDPQQQIERAMRAQINSLTDQSVALRTNTEALKADEQSVKSKIERKQLELERAEKRLRSMKKVKYETFPSLSVRVNDWDGATPCFL